MHKLALLLAPFALILTACATVPPDEPYSPEYPQAPYPPAPYAPYPPPPPPIAGDYRAVGTEPFWDLTIGREMVFTDRGTDVRIVQPTPQVIVGLAGEIYRTPRLEVNIVHRPCNDGMSDLVYPDTVDVRADGRSYRGCGGLPGDTADADDEAPPLDRTRWAVVAVNGRPTPPGDYFINFDGGRLSAKLGCNGIGATYVQTGSSLDAGPLAATRLACPDMSFESQGSDVLKQVMTIETIDANRITLDSPTGSLDLVRR